MKYLIFGLVLFVGFALWTYLFLSSERNLAAFGSASDISEGHKFGIHIGGDIDVTLERLKRKGIAQEFRPSSMKSHEGTLEYSNVASRNKECFGQKFESKYNVILLHDNSWRQGTLCLVSHDKKIVRLFWYYDWLQS